MTTPDRPLRMELTFEMPGTAEQVWDAIATANGISSWFVPTDMEERVGGLVRFHMGEDASEGTVTRFEPPHRIVYEEPDWAGLSGHAGAEVTPLVSEFIVEAQAGGTCVVRVVSSAFGTGADWEQEFFDEMEQGWAPFFDHLRLYLQHFPGQQVSRLSVDAQVPGTPEAAVHAMQQALGVEETGQQLDARGLDARGRSDRRHPPPLARRRAGPGLRRVPRVGHGRRQGQRQCRRLPVLRKSLGICRSRTVKLEGLAG